MGAQPTINHPTARRRRATHALACKRMGAYASAWVRVHPLPLSCTPTPRCPASRLDDLAAQHAARRRLQQVLPWRNRQRLQHAIHGHGVDVPLPRGGGEGREGRVMGKVGADLEAHERLCSTTPAPPHHHPSIHPSKPRTHHHPATAAPRHAGKSSPHAPTRRPRLPPHLARAPGLPPAPQCTAARYRRRPEPR